MAAKVPVAIRLAPEKLEAVDARAVRLGVSRQVLVEGFIDSGLDDAQRGVPDLPEVVESAAVAPSSGFEARLAERRVAAMDFARREGLI